MARRATAFVSKKPHTKSRGGCQICKRKKVKCNEVHPACGYCSLRKHICEYVQVQAANSSTSVSSTSSAHTSPFSDTVAMDAKEDFDFNGSSAMIPASLHPSLIVSKGQLTSQEHELMCYYQTAAWRTFAVREESAVHSVLRDYLPQLSITQSHLVYALLSISASYSNTVSPSKYAESQALFYRHKTFHEYNKALRNITADSYEAIVATGAFLLYLIPPPVENSDNEQLEWMSSLLKMSEGLRILASLRWAQGIEKLTIFPLICRELRTLPPPPLINVSVDAPIGPLGTTPDNPNPASTYKFRQPHSTRLFLPPSLMAMLRAIIVPPIDGPMEFHGGTLKPVFHALSPIFLSLYYFHLNSDFYTRVLVLASFFMPDFLQLVQAREPRALVLVAWWLALSGLVPKGWWNATKVGTVVNAIGRAIRDRENYVEQVNVPNSTLSLVEAALRTVEGIVELQDTRSKVEAAKSIFDSWPGIEWDGGPRKAAEWELEQLFNLEPDLDSCMSGATLSFS
ncbi:hypothetical protein ACN47E_008338 [Coniothyrium glycines]